MIENSSRTYQDIPVWSLNDRPISLILQEEREFISADIKNPHYSTFLFYYFNILSSYFSDAFLLVILYNKIKQQVILIEQLPHLATIRLQTDEKVILQSLTFTSFADL